MEKFIIFSLLAIGAVFGDEITPVNVCPNSDAQFISVKVETYLGICPELPCNFYRGDDVIATIKFINQVDDVNEITKKINVTFGDTELQFPLPNAHKGCDDLLGGLTCPLYAGDEVNFVLKMPVSSLYPKISLTLDFYLEDEYGVVLTCFEVEAKVVDKPKELSTGKDNSASLVHKLIKHS